MDGAHGMHERIYHILRSCVGPFFRWLFRYENAFLQPEPAAPCLVVSNHTTNYDPIFLGLSFKRHMYFVSSEHVLRAGLGAWLLRRFIAPIARQKGTTDAAAAMAILRKLRGGHSVCMFAEGNRCFNGLTGDIFPATGKMVKAADCALVTFRLEGGYFSEPRWGLHIRRGRIRGGVVRVYAPEEIKTMSAQELNAAIAADIFEDAYARQEKQRISFRGRRIAEKLETALFICPECGALGKLQSRGNLFSCACGMQARCGADGFFEAGAPFPTVAAWDRFQMAKLPDFLHGDASAPICADAGLNLRRLDGRRLFTEASGTLSLYPHKLVLGAHSFPLLEIADMAIVGRSRILFTWKDRQYEIGGPKDFCGRKYLLFYRLLRQGES